MMDDIDGYFSREGVTRPRFYSIAPGPWESWPLGHMAAPFELELNCEEVDRLARRSDYFKIVTKSYKQAQEKGHPILDLMETDGVGQYDITVPLFSNTPDIRHVVSRRIPPAMKSWVDQHDNQVQLFHKTKSRCFLTFSIHHLLIAILILSKNVGEKSIFDSYMRHYISSFTQIAGFLLSDYLLVHLAMYVVTDATVGLFQRICLHTLHLSERRFDMLMRTMERCNVSIDSWGYGRQTCLLYTYGGSVGHATSRMLRKNILSYKLFWYGQVSSRCCFCGGNLRCQLIHDIERGIQIMECCLSLACSSCFNRFLMASHVCIHTPKCFNIIHCCIKVDPFLPRSFRRAFCPMCKGGYSRGFFSWGWTLRKNRSLVRDKRLIHVYNEFELIRTERWSYISVFLRWLVRDTYPLRDWLPTHPFHERPRDWGEL